MLHSFRGTCTAIAVLAALSCAAPAFAQGSQEDLRAQIALLRQQLFDEVTLDYRTEEKLNNVPVWGFQLTCKLYPKERARRGRRK